MAKNKFYAVKNGRVPGIYTSWPKCNAQVKGFTGCKFKGFKTKEEAEAYLEGKEITKKPSITPTKKVSQQIQFKELDGSEEPEKIVEEAICVDASTKGYPGPTEYRMVFLSDQEVIYNSPVYPNGSINLGEFVALVHAIRYVQKHRSNLPIYSDSKTAIAWVRDRRLNSNFDLLQCPELAVEVKKALNYIQTHPPYDKVRKWETHLKGENPADFGRK